VFRLPPPGAAAVPAVKDRLLRFKVEAWDETGKIGEGTHRRFIIENERFLKKTMGKLRNRT
jgi:predicted thioesterase